MAKALAILDETNLSDSEIKTRLLDAKVAPLTGKEPAPDDGIRPSTETVFHAICLNLEGVNFVGHTHPTAINALTCSNYFEEAVAGRLFPDEIVMCGAAPVTVPYIDPGIPLAREIRTRILAYIQQYNERSQSHPDAKSRSGCPGKQRGAGAEHHRDDGKNSTGHSGHIRAGRTAFPDG